MQLIIAAIGRMKASPEKELLDKFIRQTPWEISIRELDAKKGLSGDSLKTAEAKLLLEATESARIRIAMDERGRHLKSEAFAKKMGDWRDNGQTPIAFIIGGQDGLESDLRKSCDFTLSLGELTWPHMLARSMLSEQLYRAHTILSGHPYHRS